MEEPDDEASFRDPNIVTQKIGSLTVLAELKVAKQLVNTSVAMGEVARAELADDRERKHGRDNYLLSFEKLMHAFDAFIKEYYSNYENKKMKTGGQDAYDLSDPTDVTLYLLWQYRNSCSHCGTLVDKDCQERYQEIYKKAAERRISPVIKLPSTLKIGTQFVPKLAQYKEIKDCVFDYMGRKIPESEKEILFNRSISVNHSFTIPRMTIAYSDSTGHYDVHLTYEDVLGAGIDLDWESKPPIIPAFYVDHQIKKIYFYKNPIWIPAIIEPRARDYKKVKFTVSINQEVRVVED